MIIYLVVMHTSDEYTIKKSFLSKIKATKFKNKINKEYKCDSFCRFEVDELEVEE